MGAEHKDHERLQIPRPQSWYQQWPFDARLTFQDEAGNHWRYMVAPTDERYLVEPKGPCVPGALPPEELEVRDHLLAAAEWRRRAGLWGKVCHLLCLRHAGHFELQKLKIQIRQLCFQSRAHRAALLRLGHARTTPAHLREELQSLVSMVDTLRQKYGC